MTPRPFGAAAAAALALLLAACSGDATEEPETAFVSGTITVAAASSGQYITGKCTAADGFEDVHTGAQITLLDSDGAVVALGELEKGRNNNSKECFFKFTIADVPLGYKFYSVDVGNAFRGVYTIAESELAKYHSLYIG
ncbi:hypothetical protein MN032_03575 [Agromyces atrinae]|uniref:hypothetical protein n=1 Tax=Agromyces atrinae TaxID=592376 RepID=UPI001F5A3BD7|nr:hypothetical protein [Agromyces atrinae]MCI2956764.1 hypothetical protein [Agromyces atrinae]